MLSKPVFAFLVCCATVMAAASGAAKEKITFVPKQDHAQPAKPESCEMRVFAEGKPDVPFVDLGVVNYHDERHRAKDGSLKLEIAMPKIKARACRAGADALIDIRVTEVRRLEFTMFNVRAVAIRFAPPE
jgi:hypothetical protein